MMMILKGDSFLLIRSVSHIIILQSCRMLNPKEIKYRSESKKLEYFGKPAPSSSRKQGCNTEVRAKNMNTSVNCQPKSKKARMQYRSESKNLEYFGKASARSLRKQEYNTEVRAKSSNTSVNGVFKTQESEGVFLHWHRLFFLCFDLLRCRLHRLCFDRRLILFNLELGYDLRDHLCHRGYLLRNTDQAL